MILPRALSYLALKRGHAFFHAYIFLLRKRSCERNFSKNCQGFQLSKNLLVEDFCTKKKFGMREMERFFIQN